MKNIILVIIPFFPTLSKAYSYLSSAWFTTTQTFVTSEANMHFRVQEMPNVSKCTYGQNWAYMDQADSGAKAQISSLLTAYAAGQQVLLIMTSVDYSSNGKNTVI